MHNRVVADAFVPCGGRPETIHGHNWREFLTKDGTPSSKLIVEGANLFLTPEARERLSAEGVTIIKDSSANKCGVICSSLEVAACMLLEEADFMAIKKQFVEEVLDRLRKLARSEAQLLVSEQERHPCMPLPEISVRLSRVVNSVADAIEEGMDSWSDVEQTMAHKMVNDHFPNILLDKVGHEVWKSLPKVYVARLIASHLAAGIVYREGISFFASMESDVVAKTAATYMCKEQEIERLVDAVESSDIPDAERIAALLKRGGTRASLSDH
jgi:glutamate dehydrogenase